MSLAEKFIEMQLSGLEGSVIEKEPLFMDGVTIKQPGTEMHLLIYQEPVSNVVSMTVYDENNKELYTNRMVFKDSEWVFLPEKSSN